MQNTLKVLDICIVWHLVDGMYFLLFWLVATHDEDGIKETYLWAFVLYLITVECDLVLLC